ncbi:hypothetical protein RYA05_01750 [Pseudomonas syringae pv. actinidiae]|nr:hypothetical protein [Pseudomonas syringae pv. actinidiae]
MTTRTKNIEDYSEILYHVRAEITNSGSGLNRHPSDLKVDITPIAVKKNEKSYEKKSGSRVKIENLMRVEALQDVFCPSFSTYCLEADVDSAVGLVTSTLRSFVSKCLVRIQKVAVVATLDPTINHRKLDD